MAEAPGTWEGYTEVVVFRRGVPVALTLAGFVGKGVARKHRGHTYAVYARVSVPNPRRRPPHKAYFVGDYAGTQAMAEDLARRIARDLAAGREPEEPPNGHAGFPRASLEELPDEVIGPR